MPQESRPERDGAKESDARTASSCFFPKFSLLFLRLRVRSKKTEESISTFDLWALSKLSPTLTLPTLSQTFRYEDQQNNIHKLK